MKVDRERFLLLAAALTTGVSFTPACGGSTTGEPAQGATAPTASMEPLVIPPIATASAPTPAPAESAPEALPPTLVARTTSPNPYDGTPVTAQSCDPALNKIGIGPACKISAPPGPTCESINDTKKECPSLNQILKPRVAQAAIECLKRKSGTKEICEFNVSSICAYEALGSACLDPAAKAICNGVTRKCGSGPDTKMSQASCEAGVSGVADAKKKKFISCISEFCRFETCLTYM